jgi:hypothetical protein
MEKEQFVQPLQREVVSYEIIDSKGEYVTAYSAHLFKNTNGRLDGLQLAKDAIRCKPDYKIVEVYENGHRQIIMDF